MTSPALGVLTLALVCSIFGSASEQTADRASEHTAHPQRTTHPAPTMTWSNVDPGTTNRDTQFDDIYLEDKIEIDKPSGEKQEKLVYNEYEDFETKNNRKDLKISQNKFLSFGEARTRNFEERKSRWRPNTMRSLSRSLPFMLRSQTNSKRAKRNYDPEKCEYFQYDIIGKKNIQHPHGQNASYYSNNVDCVTNITTDENKVVKLTFVDVFHIEFHPKCEHDFLEIRDGKHGYAKLIGKYCGETFPQPVRSSGPYLWLKFHSDDTIEYEGFSIKVEFEDDTSSRKIPDSCYHEIKNEMTHVISSDEINPDCLKACEGRALDVLWTIITDENTNIYLNFTHYNLQKPNECEENVVQVFGDVLEFDSKLAHYCGSVANAVTTTSKVGNMMHIRLFVGANAREKTKFNATFTAFRTLDTKNNDQCPEDEFSCQDNTCIPKSLTCNEYGDCKLKTDEDEVLCAKTAESTLKEPHIITILVIFCLILSGMSFVFLFKCIRKLYQDHKIIKEHIAQSTEERLDILTDNEFRKLDPRHLKRDSEPRDRASLERENHTNELVKQQRSISQHKHSSIESDFQETHLDLDDDEPYSLHRREVETIPEALDIKVEPHRNGRMRRSDTSKKEELIRSRKESVEEKKEIRDAAVGAPDTKESGCQTRESLFQADPAPSSDGSNSNSNSRGFSTFGYSGATLVRPSPPPAVSSMQIELLRQIPSQDSGKSQKKLSDRRPMSTETTRSAPDVIIVSKPIR